MGMSIIAESLARDVQQRADQPAGAKPTPRRNPCESVRSSPPHHAQQQGLELIVGMVGGQKALARLEPGGNRGIARLTRRIFKPAPDFGRVGPGHRQGNAETLAYPAAMSRPLVGPGLQAMVDMDGTDRPVRLRGEVQKHGRVEPAAEGNDTTPGIPRQGSGELCRVGKRVAWRVIP